MPTIQTSETELYYEEFGDGIPVVFTNSGLASHRMWDGQVTDLAAHYATITYDWRGTGFSRRSQRGYTAQAAAGDLVNVIEKVAAAPAVLVAHGVGTHVTLLATQMRPDLVRGLVLADGAPWFKGTYGGIVGGPGAEFSNAMADAYKATYPDMLDTLARNWMFHSTPSEAVIMSIVHDGLTWPVYVRDQFDRALVNIDHRGYLREISAPANVIHGRYDYKQHYQGGKYLAETLPNATLVTLENSAHMGHIEERNKFNRSVYDLIEHTRRSRDD